MGVYDHVRRQLASPHVAVAHARLSDFWCEAGMAPFCERAASWREHGAGFWGSASHDRHGVAQRISGCIVCCASVARRVGGVDFGAQRLVEHVLWTAGDMGLRTVRARAIMDAIWMGRMFFRIESVEQADAGHPSVRFLAAGRLATQKILE